MRKSILLSFTFLLFSFFCEAQFTAGNIAVIQAAASATNTTCSVIELNKTSTAQTPVSTVTIDGTGANALRFSGSATSTGYLANSNDGSLLCFTGANNTNTSSNVNTLNPRGVGTLTASQTFNLATTYTGTSGNQTRCATSLNNTTWFIADQGGAYSNGTSGASPTGNFRGIKSFGGIVYVGAASGTGTVIQVSTLSAATGGTVTGLPGLTNLASHQDFYLISSGTNGTAFDILYVIGATSNTAGTIYKYSLVSGTWVVNGTYNTTFGGFGIAAEKDGTGASLFVSTGQGALVANSVIRLTDDAGYNSTINITTGNNIILYTAPTSTIVKGVAFTPVATAPPTPSVNLSVSSNTGTEAGTTAITVTATASAAVSGNQTVDLAVTGNNITIGDYTLSGTTITIPGGSTTGSVTFTVVDDADVEGLETAILTISNPSVGIILGATTTQNIDITDNDVVLPTVALSVSSNTGSEAAATSITVTATASAPVTGNQTVTLAVSGTGVTANDYSISGTTITILNGQTTGSVTFGVRNDVETEGTETAVLTISNPSAGITLGTPTVQNIAITDNVCQPLIRKSTVTSTNGAEISAFDPVSSRVYTVAGPVVEYYSLSNTGILSGSTNLPFGFTSPGNTILPNSVAIRNGIVAVGYAIVGANNAQLPGAVAFYNSTTGAYINHVTVGYLPDMIIFTPDGTKILTANEGEPNSYGQGTSFDPEGSISIIDISGGVASATVQTAGFTSFNGSIAALRAAGVRIYGPGATVAQDLEPEYISFSNDGATAFVTLQEANAIAEVNIATATVTQILPLGLKNHNLVGNGLDASDADGGIINIQNWPIYGMYQPDAISSFSVGGTTYYITANEGDSRAWTGFNEEIRVGNGSYILDPTVFPNAATLKLNQNLGRLQLTNATGDIDNDGDFDQIHAFGARSFSIWNSTFSSPIFDSGDQLEQITAAQSAASFNSDGTSATFDTRSDNKGPEPEAVTTGMINGVLYAFVGSERTGDIFVYDISNPASPVFKQYIDHPADLGVEGLFFVPANESPTGRALVIVSAEVSRTVTVYEFSLIPQSLATTNIAVTSIQGASTSFGDCSGLIATVTQNGPSPVTGSVDAEVWIEATQPAGFVKRHYEITPATNAATATGRVTLYFTQQDFDDFNAVNTTQLPQNSGDASGKLNLLVEKRTGTSNDGTGLPNSYSGTISTINPNDADIVWNAAANRWEVTFDVTTGFSGFFIKTISGVLPVNWLTVSGTINSLKQPSLQWKVAEIEVEKYLIEKSINGNNYVQIGTINSIGDGVNSYQFTEPAILNGTAYYRIKQIDKNGRSGYSSIIRLSNNQTEGLLTLYPNPATDKLVVSVGVGLQNSIAYIFDLQGKQIQQIQLQGQTTSININQLPVGMYMLRFANGQTEKFVKQRQ